MNTTDKRCPQCGETYDRDKRFCPRDGTELVLAEPPPEPPPAPPQEPTQSPARKSWLQQIPKERVVGIGLVGIVVVVVLVVLAVREVRVYRLSVIFEEGHGLKVGDSVMVREVQVGEVVGADVEGDQFVATLAIQPDAADLFREESVFYVGYEKIATQKRALKVLESDPKNNPIPSGSEVHGEDSILAVWTEILKRSGPKEIARFREEFKDALPSGLEGIKDVLKGEWLDLDL